MIANAPDSERKPFDHTVEAMTAGAAPPAAVIEAMETQGFNVTHVYGLTETYGLRSSAHGRMNGMIVRLPTEPL